MSSDPVSPIEPEADDPNWTCRRCETVGNAGAACSECGLGRALSDKLPPSASIGHDQTAVEAVVPILDEIAEAGVNGNLDERNCEADAERIVAAVRSAQSGEQSHDGLRLLVGQPPGQTGWTVVGEAERHRAAGWTVVAVSASPEWPGLREKVRARLARIDAPDGDYSITELCTDLEKLANHPVWKQAEDASVELERLSDELASEREKLTTARVNCGAPVEGERPTLSQREFNAHLRSEETQATLAEARRKCEVWDREAVHRSVGPTAVTLTRDRQDGGWVAEASWCPGGAGQGESREEAVGDLLAAIAAVRGASSGLPAEPTRQRVELVLREYFDGEWPPEESEDVVDSLRSSMARALSAVAQSEGADGPKLIERESYDEMKCCYDDALGKLDEARAEIERLTGNEKRLAELVDYNPAEVAEGDSIDVVDATADLLDIRRGEIDALREQVASLRAAEPLSTDLLRNPTDELQDVIRAAVVGNGTPIDIAVAAADHLDAQHSPSSLPELDRSDDSTDPGMEFAEPSSSLSEQSDDGEPVELAAMREILADPEAAMRALPEDEQKRYREAQASIVRARNNPNVGDIVLGDRVAAERDCEFKLFFGSESWPGVGWAVPNGMPGEVNLIVPIEGKTPPLAKPPWPGIREPHVAVTVNRAALLAALGVPSPAVGLTVEDPLVAFARWWATLPYLARKDRLLRRLEREYRRAHEDRGDPLPLDTALTRALSVVSGGPETAATEGEETR